MKKNPNDFGRSKQTLLCISRRISKLPVAALGILSEMMSQIAIFLLSDKNIRKIRSEFIKY